jgi:hypothetical protein
MGDVRGRGIGEPVGALYVDSGPDARAVVVVQIEEGCCVESGDMMLLYYLLATYIVVSGVVIFTSHVSRWPVGIWSNYDLRMLAAMPGGCVCA